jgi:hypothetical protein
LCFYGQVLISGPGKPGACNVNERQAKLAGMENPFTLPPPAGGSFRSSTLARLGWHILISGCKNNVDKGVEDIFMKFIK